MFKKSFIWLIAILLSSGLLSAAPRTEQAARAIAHKLLTEQLSLRSNQSNLLLESAPERQAFGNNLPLTRMMRLSGQIDSFNPQAEHYYYVYNRGNNGGFVIVSGDDRLPEVIAYAPVGYFDTKAQPEHMRHFFNMLQVSIDQMLAMPETVDLKRLIKGNDQPALLRADLPATVAPLLGGIQWNQTEPWNAKTPTSNYEHTPVGCLATAYTQIMRFHQWPNKGKGQYSYTYKGHNISANFEVNYDWANMPEAISHNSYTTAQEKALSTLSYHAGVAVDMQYAAAGSGAYPAAAVRALRDHFRYDKGVYLAYREVYTQSEWNQLIKSELAARRPVSYGGSSAGGGHAFVCDGYDNQGLFHINWGWAGMSDGYFSLDLLNPSALGTGGGSGGGFNFMQSAIVNIKPDRTGNSTAAVPVITTYTLEGEYNSNSRVLECTFMPRLLSIMSEQAAFRLKVEQEGGDNTYYSDRMNQKTLSWLEANKYNLPRFRLPADAPCQSVTYRLSVEFLFNNQYYPLTHINGYASEAFLVFDAQGQGTIKADDYAQAPQVASVNHVQLQSYESGTIDLVFKNGRKDEFRDGIKIMAQTKQPDGSLVNHGLISSEIITLPADSEQHTTIKIDRCPFAADEVVNLTLAYEVYNGTSGKYEDVIIHTIKDIRVAQANNIRPAFTLTVAGEVTDGIAELNQQNGTVTFTNIGSEAITGLLSYRFILVDPYGKSVVTDYRRRNNADIPSGQSFDVNLAQLVMGRTRPNVAYRVKVQMANYEDYELTGMIPVYPSAFSTVKFASVVDRDHSISFTMSDQWNGTSSHLAYIEGNSDLEGESCTLIEKSYQGEVYYEVIPQAKNWKIVGNVTRYLTISFDHENSYIQSIDCSQAPNLRVMGCIGSMIKGSDMVNMIASLPDRQGRKTGKLALIYDNCTVGDNKCTDKDLKAAKAKNWSPLRFTGQDYVEYVATAIESISDIQMHLYPNPTTDRIRVANAPAYTPIYIYTMAGTHVLTHMTDSAGEANILVNRLPKGFYMVQCGATSVKLQIQ